MTPAALRRLKALVPAKGVFIDATQAKRLFDATSPVLTDEERVAHVKAVLRMLEAPDSVVSL